MLMDVCCNGIAPFEKGHSTLLKVRLLHARVRYFLLQKKKKKSDQEETKEDLKQEGNNNNDEWNIEEWGIPINQEDMCITAMMFTQVFCKGRDNMKRKI